MKITANMLKKSLLIGILGFGTIIILFPMYITFVTALKTPAESARSFFSLPKALYLNNFIEVINAGGYLTACLNSLVITIFSVGFMIVFAPMAAYAFCRNTHNKVFNSIYLYMILGMFIPFQIIMFPVVKTMSDLRLMNIAGLIILYISIAIPKTVFLYFGYMKTVPVALEESALIDGASTLQIYIKIVYPLLSPITATVVIIQSLWIWNDFLLPLIILNRSAKFWTLPLFQYNFKGQYFIQYNLIFAAFVLSMLPMMAVYIFLQRYLIAGLTSGAVKS